mgnify:CR=1 FL=1
MVPGPVCSVRSNASDGSCQVLPHHIKTEDCKPHREIRQPASDAACAKLLFPPTTKYQTYTSDSDSLFSYRAYLFMLMCLLFYGRSLLQISALLLARQISGNKLNLILCPGNFRDAYFKRKKIFILNVFDARLKINGKIQSVASDLIYLQRAYPRFKKKCSIEIFYFQLLNDLFPFFFYDVHIPAHSSSNKHNHTLIFYLKMISESIKNHKLIHNFLKIRVETLLKLLDGDSFFDYNEIRCLKNVNKLLFI